MWEERWHPLRREWVVIAAHRNQRPWSGNTAAKTSVTTPTHLSDCYLCPGNARVHGAANPAYQGIFVFDNDHPCVGPEAPLDLPPAPAPYRRRDARGKARVVCYTPRHDLRLARLSVARIDALLACWAEQERELARVPGTQYVLMFENNGPAVGVSNPHPHCQIYATNFVFRTVEEIIRAEREQGGALMAEIIRAERADGSRILHDADGALSFVPWFARYGYETYVVPERRVPRLAALTDGERRALAAALKAALVRLDNLWQMPMPYVLVLHQAPSDGSADSDVHTHIVIQPPLRKPDLIKYLAGPEIGGGNFIADTLPEQTAAQLRAVSGTHYCGDVDDA